MTDEQIAAVLEKPLDQSPCRRKKPLPKGWFFYAYTQQQKPFSISLSKANKTGRPTKGPVGDITYNILPPLRQEKKRRSRAKLGTKGAKLGELGQTQAVY
ncbi:MAG: hypothetical protein OQK35_07630 [Alphaproteobacteria bacterium]|nr:hypothetical protein [Alphaproteobacteria bacterium]